MNKTQTLVVLGTFVAILVIGGLMYYQQVRETRSPAGREAVASPLPNASVPSDTDENQVMCPMDARECPDGSYVGRVAPNCEFAPCPGEAGAGSDVITTNWQTLNSPHYSISYPEQFEVRQQGTMDSLVALGPTQTQGTEVYDGVIFNITSHETGQSLEAFAQERFTQVKNDGVSEIIEPLAARTVGSYQGYHYRSSGLGEFDHYYVRANPQQPVVEIMLLVSDPTGQGFEAVVEEMLNTLQLK